MQGTDYYYNIPIVLLFFYYHSHTLSVEVCKTIDMGVTVSATHITGRNSLGSGTFWTEHEHGTLSWTRFDHDQELLVRIWKPDFGLRILSFSYMVQDTVIFTDYPWSSIMSQHMPLLTSRSHPINIAFGSSGRQCTLYYMCIVCWETRVVVISEFDSI